MNNPPRCYGHDGKQGVCYKCTKRKPNCHAYCIDYAIERLDRKDEYQAKMRYLFPKGSHYFRENSKIPSTAVMSKKKYR